MLPSSPPIIHQRSFAATLITTTLLLYLVARVSGRRPTSAQFPLTCAQFTNLDAVARRFRNEEAPQEFDTLSNFRLRRKSWTRGARAFTTETHAAASQVAAQLAEPGKISRKIHDKGMHKHVVTTVEAVEAAPQHQCWLMIEEHVTTSLFIDVYELERSHTSGFLYSQYIDIELPEYESSEHSVLVYTSLLTTLHPRNHGNGSSNSVEVDWHIRYHRPSSEPYTNVVIPTPRYFTYCEEEASAAGDDLLVDSTATTTTAEPICPGFSSSDVLAPCPGFLGDGPLSLCPWHEFTNAGVDDLVVKWPVGNSRHEALVTNVTMLVVVLGAAAVIRSAYMRKTFNTGGSERSEKSD